MSAGFAAADVAVSGSARMGVVATDGASAFSSRVRMSFTGSGTTDSGLAFGGSFDAQDTQAANAGTSGSVFISGAFGKISMGGVDSGDAAAVGQLASVGYEGLGSTNSINYAADGFDLFGLVEGKTTGINGGTVTVGPLTGALSANITDAGGAKVLYTYSAGALSVSASTSQISNGGSHSAYGIGAAYTTGGLTLAAGYGRNEFDVVVGTTALSGYSGDAVVGVPAAVLITLNGDVTDATVSATYVMGDTTIKAIYQDKQASASPVLSGEDLSVTATSMGMSVSHKIDAMTLTAFGVTTDLTDNFTGAFSGGAPADSMSVSRYGVGVAYDLGGGASLKAGAVNVEFPQAHVASDQGVSAESVSYSAYDVGVSFKF